MITSTVFGTGPAVQHQFRGGDPASATQVNENFQELADRIQEINDQLRTYDYHTYITPSDITSKSFSVTPVGNNNVDCVPAQENRQYDRTPQGNDLLITVTHIQADPNTNQTCSYYSFQYLSTAERLLLLKNNGYDKADTNAKSVVYEHIYNDEISILMAAMKEGASWGSVSSTTTTDYSLVPPFNKRTRQK